MNSETDFADTIFCARLWKVVYKLNLRDVESSSTQGPFPIDPSAPDFGRTFMPLLRSERPSERVYKLRLFFRYI